MKCITCGEEAAAICQFCGRAVCQDHIKQDLFTSGFSAKGGFWNMQENAVRVKDAVWCGVCHPEHKTTT
jgi:hypothetical protein